MLLTIEDSPMGALPQTVVEGAGGDGHEIADQLGFVGFIGDVV